MCEQVYQVYARQSPEEVHAILRATGADYVVLENSICYERRHRRGCRLRDLLDLANGHVGGIYLTGLFGLCVSIWLCVCWGWCRAEGGWVQHAPFFLASYRVTALSLHKDQWPTYYLYITISQSLCPSSPPPSLHLFAY